MIDSYRDTVWRKRKRRRLLYEAVDPILFYCMPAQAKSPIVFMQHSPTCSLGLRCRLEFRLLLEEHAERDDCAVDEQTTSNGHDHSTNRNQIRVCEDDGECCHTAGQRWPDLILFPTGPRGGLPIPMTTKNPVQKRPRSITPAPELSTKSSGLAQRPQIQLGSGAIT